MSSPREPTAAAPQPPSSAMFEYAPPPYFAASSRVPKWLQSWIADTFTFILIHYNLWPIPFVVLFYYLFQVRAYVRAFDVHPVLSVLLTLSRYGACSLGTLSSQWRLWYRTSRVSSTGRRALHTVGRGSGCGRRTSGASALNCSGAYH